VAPPPVQPKPPIPDTVRNAFYLMLGAAALQVVGIIGSLAQISDIRRAVRDALRDQPDTTENTINAAVNFTIAIIVIIGLLFAGLWVWMAFANRAGKNWARITGTVFFGILSLLTLFSLISAAGSASNENSMTAGTTSSAVSWVINIIIWIAGLVTVILLWNSRSSAYFQGAAASYGYGYQPEPPYPPPSGPAPGQTAPGQTAPPAGPPPSDGPQDMPPPR
jgi:small-conductance mechanosensitive channel